jgi:tetratricopeptide (TPR) repeat protein/transcriptional regulator with XRE-family HTH domain
MKLHPLRVERELRGWSQAKLAEAIGTTIRSVSRWEQGLAMPYPHYRERLCVIFNKTARELGLLSTANESDVLAAASEEPSFLFDPTIPEIRSCANSLLGRNELLLQIKQRLLNGERLGLTALSGLPGIGKTTLAVMVATDKEVMAHFHNGILWAGLGPHPNVLGLLARWGILLGIKPTDVENVNNWEAWGRALQAVINNRRLLLIIDDAWSIEGALAFQVGGAQCAHLLTTRLPQVAFAFAQQGALVIPELKETDGLALLAHFVPQLVQEDPENARALVRAAGALPLALTLMGKYLAAQVPTGQPRRLQAALVQLYDASQRLRVSVPTPPNERSPSFPENTPLSLHAAITISAQQLSPQAHVALCALAVFPAKPNSFSEEAALAVCQEPVETLDTLWDAGLIESSGPCRYTLHQTIADYAQTMHCNCNTQDQGICHPYTLQEWDGMHSECLVAARQRLVNYMLSFVQTHEQDYEALDYETSNILAALNAAVALEMQEALLQGVVAFVTFLRVRGHYSLANQYLQSALQVATALEDPTWQVTILRRLATFAQLCGDYSQAEHYGQLGLKLARQLECIDEISALQATLGLVAFYRGDNDYAQACLQEGLQLARQVGNSEQICTLLSDLGRVARSQGNFSQAQALYHEGLVLAQENEYWDLMSFMLAFLGAITREQGNYDQAEQYCLEGLDLARRQGHREHLSHLLTQLGAIAYYRGKYKKAEAYFHEGLAIVRQIGHRAQICRLLANLGPPLTAQGHYARAELYLQEGVELARQLGNRDSLPFLLMNLGSAIGYQGDYERANACFQEGVEVSRHLGSPWLISSILRDWGDIHLKYRQLDAATAAFQEVLALTSGSGQDPYLIAQAHYGLAQIAALRGDLTEARHLGTKSLTAFESLGHHKAREVRKLLQSLPN